MKIGTIAAFAAAAALAGCGGGEKEASGNAAAAAGGTEAASAAGGATVELQPGLWEVTVETGEMKGPDVPDGSSMAGMMPKTTVRTCVTPEQARQPGGDLFAGKQDGNCTAKDFSAAGGRIRGTMTCSGGDTPGTMTMELDGTYSSTAWDHRSKMKMTGAGMDMEMELRNTGRRIGECPAGGAEAGA